MKKLFLFLVAVNCQAASFFTIDNLVNAIHQIETSGKVGAILGDNGKALGPLQIHLVAWADAAEFDQSIGGKYSDCSGLKYSKKIFIAYSTRYVRGKNFNSLTLGDCEVIARKWNGGPNGDKKAATLKYWEKVKSFLIK